MALLHQAELRPSKIELLDGWARAQPWFEGDAGASLTSVASFRFDDPDGEVGIETLLVRAGEGPVLQVPLTYRAAPLAGGEAWLVGTTEHSVLGRRWVYDATGDPVYVAAIVTAAVTGGNQAEQYFEIDGVRVFREPTAEVVGSGTHGADVPTLPSLGGVSTRPEPGATVVRAGAISVVVARVPGTRVPGVPGAARPDGPGADTARAELSGTWAGRPEAQILATVSFPGGPVRS